MPKGSIASTNSAGNRVLKHMDLLRAHSTTIVTFVGAFLCTWYFPKFLHASSHIPNPIKMAVIMIFPAEKKKITPGLVGGIAQRVPNQHTQGPKFNLLNYKRNRCAYKFSLVQICRLDTQLKISHCQYLDLGLCDLEFNIYKHAEETAKVNPSSCC